MPKDEFDPEDPMEFVGMACPGTPESDEQMAIAVVEEYLMFGFDRDRIMRLFQDPFYAGTNRIYVEKGESYVSGIIDRVLAEWGSGVVGAGN